MKRLKKGFTLIELLVVIAIIGILATTLAPKLREQLAKAKDAKAIAFLGATRIAASALAIDHMVQTTTGTVAPITEAELVSRLDAKSKELYTVGGTSVVLVGGTRKSLTDSVVYDGTGVTLVTGGTGDDLTGSTLAGATATGIPVSGDEVILHLLGASEKTFSTEGKLWSKY